MVKSPGLDKFLEMDMLEFLDKKKPSSGPVDEADDYYSEVRDSLKKRDTDKVLDILEGAADKYNKIEENDPYKDLAYNKFVEALQLLESYKEDSEELKSVSELAKESKLQEERPFKIHLFEERKKARERKAFEEKEREYELKEEIKANMKKSMHELFINIRKKDLAASINSYKTLKNYFEEFPSRFIDEKKELYNDLLSYYIQIRKLKKELQQSTTSISKDKIRDIEANKKKYLNPKAINSIIDGIKRDVKEKDFTSAKEKVLELKHMTSSIPEDKKNARALLESKIKSITQKVDFAKRTWEHSQHIQA